MKKIAIVGCGRISNKHIEAIRQTNQGEIIGFCDINLDKAELLAGIHGGRAYNSIKEMAADLSFDLVAVLTESGNHADHVVSLTECGCDILVEKPMALTRADAQKMVDAASAAGVRLYEVKQNRYNRAIVALREAYSLGRFGDLIMGTIRVRWCRTQDYYDQAPWRGTWSLDGGVLSNQAVHHLDMLIWFMGPVESISAKSITAGVDIEAEDTIVCILKFKNGALGIIEATTAIRPKNVEGSISIVGSTGFAEIGGIAMNEVVNWQFSESTSSDLKQNFEEPDGVYGFGHSALYDDLLGVSKEQTKLVTGSEALEIITVLEAAYESVKTNKEIFL
jgi:UDP-N-acetyl-2-amino-2-deoxyglucuronate dehydrogenase